MAVRLTGQGAPDLAKVLRDAGLRVDESVVPDWRSRSRTSNTSWYKDPGPTHVMVHDTATPITSHNTLLTEKREAYICGITHPVKPVSNVYLGPTTGIWYPLAGGPSNTNGEGDDTWGGGTPADSMNSYAIAIEYGNNGVGEPFIQWLSYVTGVAALCKAYNIPVGHVRAHFEWAPSRKIDLSGGRGYNGPFVRVPADPYGRINMDEFRGAVFAAMLPPPPPPDPEVPVPPLVPGVFDVKYIIRYTASGDNPAKYAGPIDFGAGDGPSMIWLSSAAVRNDIVAKFAPKLVTASLSTLEAYELVGPLPNVNGNPIFFASQFATHHP